MRRPQESVIVPETEGLFVVFGSGGPVEERSALSFIFIFLRSVVLRGAIADQIRRQFHNKTFHTLNEL